MTPPLLVNVALVAPGARPRVRRPVVPKYQLFAPLFTVTPSANSRSLRMVNEPPKVMSVPTVTPFNVMELGAW